MRIVVFTLCAIFSLISSSLADNLEQREFKLERDHFRWIAKQLDYYPFTNDLASIDEGISGEFVYSWSIGYPQPRHILQAACMNDEDKVLVGWWRAKNRSSRVMALAVFYCTRDDTSGRFPSFGKDVERFEVGERRERKEELTFVRKYRDFFRRLFLELTSDTLPDDSGFMLSLASPRK